MSELLPCPFCGEPTHIHVYPPTCRPETPYNPADRLFPIARCAKCYAEVAGKNEDYGMKSAIAAWNTRSSQAEIERLKAALSKMANEVFGLSAFEAELRSVMGNTNWSVLRQRAEEARAALSGSKE